MKLPRNWLALCRNWPSQYRCGQLVSGHFNGRETMRSSRMLERLNNKCQQQGKMALITIIIIIIIIVVVIVREEITQS